METLSIEKALQRPDAYLFVEKLHAALDIERAQREHFYEIVEENRKMEFINGEIIFHSPVKKWHNTATGNVFMLFNTYAIQHDLGYVGIEKIMISLTRNDYEPDVCFFRKEVADTFADDQMQFPAPNLIVEVLSPSTEKHDRETKFIDYAAHGVQEYWIIDPKREFIEQHILQGEFYDLRIKATDGAVHCAVMPGLSFPVRAIFDRAECSRVVRGM